MDHLRKFVAPEFLFGAKARTLVGQYAHNLGMGKVLLVSDPGVVAAGWAGSVEASLSAAGIQWVRFTEVSSNPRDLEVHAGLEVYRREDCDSIVAVGGGSPMDCAKGIGIMARNAGHILDYEGVDTIQIPCPPLICVPTTAGTSADVSQFCIITDTARRTKIAIVSKALVPDLALIDPETTLTMDADLTAHTGMDALTHAVEALGSNASSAITDLHALEAIRLVMAHLEAAHQGLDDLEKRTPVMLASLHAGLAFSNASLGAVHAMAHALGGLGNLPHGECNAILLPLVMDYNYDAAEATYRRMLAPLGLEGRTTTDREGVKRAILEAVAGIQNRLGIVERLGALGVTQADLPGLAERALADPCMVTNPRTPTRAEIVNLYEQAL